MLQGLLQAGLSWSGEGAASTVRRYFFRETINYHPYVSICGPPVLQCRNRVQTATRQHLPGNTSTRYTCFRQVHLLHTCFRQVASYRTVPVPYSYQRPQRLHPPLMACSRRRVLSGAPGPTMGAGSSSRQENDAWTKKRDFVDTVTQGFIERKRSRTLKAFPRRLVQILKVYSRKEARVRRAVPRLWNRSAGRSPIMAKHHLHAAADQFERDLNSPVSLGVSFVNELP